MKLNAEQLIDALKELVLTQDFIRSTDSCGYGAVRVLVDALHDNKEYMELPLEVTVEIKE